MAEANPPAPDFGSRIEAILSQEEQEGVLQSAPAETEQQEPEEVTESTDPVEEVEDEAVDPGTEPETEIEADAEEALDAAEASDDPGINTLPELAEAFGVSEEELLGTIQIPGPNGDVLTMADAVSALTNGVTNEAVDQQVQEVQARMQEVSQLREQQIAEHDSALERAQHLASAMISAMELEGNSTDWKGLEENDPGEYIRLRKLQEERQGIVQGVISEFNQESQKRTEEAQRQQMQFRANEVQRLQQKMPDWRDTSKAQDAMQEVQRFLSLSGFTPEEVATIDDHRLVLVAYQAAQFQKMKSQAPATKKKLGKLPKVTLKGKARRVDEERVKSAHRQKVNRLRKTGDYKDAAAIFEEIL